MSISRRTALATGAAAVVTGALTAPLAMKAAGVKAALAGPPVEPLLALEQDWLAQRDYIHNYPDDSDAALNLLYDRQHALERGIMAAPARSFAGIAVKLRLATYYIHPGSLDREGFDWDERFTLHALSDAERLARGSIS